MAEQVLTPMMAQWQACKTQAKDALLLFRLGDFYEAFQEDAALLSKEVHLTLTARQGIPMCGIPFHTADVYIDKMIAKGYKIAIAEQTEEPKPGKGLVRREITRIVTPGTIISSQLLSEKKNNFFASVIKTGKVYGLSYLDVSTGEFYAFEIETFSDLIDALHRIRPAEFLAGYSFLDAHEHFFTELSHAFPFILNQVRDIDVVIAEQTLVAQFGSCSVRKNALMCAAGMLLLYLKEELNLGLEQVTSIRTENLDYTMAIDHATLHHLDLLGALLDFLDHTATPMGARLLTQWLKAPLLACAEIAHRQNSIALFLSDFEKAQQVRAQLHSVRDLERLVMKILTQAGGPRDVYALGKSLACLPTLKELLDPFQIPDCTVPLDVQLIAEKIVATMQESPPLRMGEGDIFVDHVYPELDQLRTLARESLSWIARYQTTLREETGIKTLKVGYTRAFGYYIEVSKTKSTQIPSTFQRTQTLVNGERFTTEELKQFEHQILTAEQRAQALEAQYFDQLRSEIAQNTVLIQKIARVIARIDALLSLALVAKKNHFTRPTVDESDLLEIREGRHPIVEKAIGREAFIPNDTILSPQKQMMLITGPNMAGKSTYIRQVAVIVILAQIGSYVPASAAHIGLVDRVFSRIGASDDLARGQSTFMVEMQETAHILHHATSRSLVLLDEIGRGTSTYDGISIAWAVAEFLLTTTRRMAKTLFATHYWELTELANTYTHIANYQTAVQETASGIVFLRKIIMGGTDKSYGIHVAKLANLPKKVIQRAEEMLIQLEAKAAKPESQDEQLLLFSAESFEHPILSELKQLDINHTTPLQALQKLLEWKAICAKD